MLEEQREPDLFDAQENGKPARQGTEELF